MDVRVLVTYATKYGATQEIAEKIGEVLGQAGLQADVLAADRVKDLAPYQAVVLGSAVYVGSWRKEAVRFLEKNEAALGQRPVWIFSSGPTGEGDPVELMEGWELPPKLVPIVDRVKPRDVTIFHGAADLEKMSFIDKRMLKMVKAPIGDFRDWDAIGSWAEGIAAALKETTTGT